jgi:hypothetical protein
VDAVAIVDGARDWPHAVGFSRTQPDIPDWQFTVQELKLRPMC